MSKCLRKWSEGARCCLSSAEFLQRTRLEIAEYRESVLSVVVLSYRVISAESGYGLISGRTRFS